MEKIKEDIDNYLKECSGVKNNYCFKKHYLIHLNILDYHNDIERKHYNCNKRLYKCEKVGYSSILNSLTYLPMCYDEGKKCIKEVTEDFKFIKTCFDKLNQ